MKNENQINTTTILSVRVGLDTLEELQAISDVEDRTISNVVRIAIKEYLERQKND